MTKSRQLTERQLRGMILNELEVTRKKLSQVGKGSERQKQAAEAARRLTKVHERIGGAVDAINELLSDSESAKIAAASGLQLADLMDQLEERRDLVAETLHALWQKTGASAGEDFDDDEEA